MLQIMEVETVDCRTLARSLEGIPAALEHPSLLVTEHMPWGQPPNDRCQQPLPATPESGNQKRKIISNKGQQTVAGVG
ncbi:MAG: hypothetical protein IH610_05190 [Deltaproteobacteria bacterium]|nr:hypothetical protein [Deltaproteobacteria bacterium]